MPEIEINVDGEDSESEPEEIDEWETVRLALVENSNLLREVVTEIRSQTSAMNSLTEEQRALVPSLLATNTSLVETLANTPNRTMELLTPLLSPPAPVIVVEEPLLNADAGDQGGAITPADASLETQAESPRRKFRVL